VCCSALLFVAACYKSNFGVCGVLQCIAIHCCSALQYTVVRRSDSRTKKSESPGVCVCAYLVCVSMCLCVSFTQQDCVYLFTQQDERLINESDSVFTHISESDCVVIHISESDSVVSASM